MQYKAFELADYDSLTRQEKKDIIRSKMFLKEKYLPDGKFDKIKARLVAGGHMQHKELYTYDETSSPTVSQSVLMALSAIASERAKKITTVDIKSAYLNATMPNCIHMKLDKTTSQLLVKKTGWRNNSPDGCILVKLTKALYGCLESAKLFYKHLRKTFEDIGYVASSIDACVFSKTQDGEKTIIVTHVDDVKIMSESDYETEIVIDQMRKVYGDIKVNSGTTHNYLGMSFDYSHKGEVEISMKQCVDTILVEYPVVGTAKTPANVELFEIDEKSPLLGDNDRETFHSTVMRLLYLVKRIRPDMMVSVSFLTTRTSKPTEEDKKKLERVLRYLQGTRELGQILKADAPLQLTCYVDAAHAVHSEYKGHTGGLTTIGKGCVHSKSAKQRLVSKSSTESELVAVSDYIGVPMQLSEILRELGYAISPIFLKQDNQSTIKLIERGKPASESTRHINIRYFFLKDKVDKKEITLGYCPTEDMRADALTKPLVGSRFIKHRNWMMGLKVN